MRNLIVKQGHVSHSFRAITVTSDGKTLRVDHTLEGEPATFSTFFQWPWRIDYSNVVNSGRELLRGSH